MRLCLSLLALASLSACATTDEDPSGQTEGSSGVADTDGDAESGGPSSSDDPSSPTGTSTTAAPTTGPTTSVTSGADDSGVTTDDSATSGPSSDSETSGGADTSSAEESGGDDGAAVQCVELAACCDEIGSALYGGCMSVVDMDSPELCDSILTNYHQEGYCTGETFCAELGDCCSELPPGPGWQDTCEYYADFGNQPQCAMLIGDYQLSDYCF